MKELWERSGRFAVRLWFEDGEIDRIMEDELRRARLMPAVSQPEVDVEAFIEKRLGIVPETKDLPDGVLGATHFEDGKPTVISVQPALMDQAIAGSVMERRLRSTLAHEAGHSLLHPPLFLPNRQTGLFECRDVGNGMLCKDVNPAPKGSSSYGGEWWEYQANQAIGSLLMPKGLFSNVFETFLGSRSRASLEEGPIRQEIEQRLSLAFNVSREAARYRLENLKLMPPRGQRSLDLDIVR